MKVVGVTSYLSRRCEGHIPARCHRHAVYHRVLEPRVQCHTYQPVDLLSVGHDTGHVRTGNAWYVRHAVAAGFSISDDRRLTATARRYSGCHR